MIIIYPASGGDYDTNGLGILQPVSASVREVVNGEYALTAVFADADLIVEDRVLKAMTPKGLQLFRIREINKTLDGMVEVYALHIFYDLADDMILDKYPTAVDGQDAITNVLSGTDFTGYSDIETVSSARYVYKSVVDALINKENENAFINRWGGEVERDNFYVTINTRIGADNGVSIRYRKNLTGLEASTNISEVKTRIYPTGLYGNDTLLTNGYVDSPLIANYAKTKVGRAHFSDVKVGDDYTEAEAKAELLARANALFDAGADKPTVTLKVEFVELADTVEYADYADLESVYLGDTVHVAHEPLDIDLTLRVVEYVYDSERERYISVTIGDLPDNIGTSIIGADIDISVLRQEIDQTVVKQGSEYNNVSISAEHGFMAAATILGHEIVTKMNATDGFTIEVDDVKMFGVDSTGRVFTTAVSNVDNSGYYMTYGYDGSPGLECFMPTEGKWLGISPDITGGIQIYDKNSDLRMLFDGSGTFRVYDGTRSRFNLWSDGSMQINDANGQMRLRTDSGVTSMISPDGNNEIYLTNTAAYKKIGSTVTQL